jgi:Mg-chelatase subunit ChlI
MSACQPNIFHSVSVGSDSRLRYLYHIRTVRHDCHRYSDANNNNNTMKTRCLYILFLGLTTDRAIEVMSFGIAPKTKHSLSLTLKLQTDTQTTSSAEERKLGRDDFITRDFEAGAPLPPVKPFGANDSDYSRPFPMDLIVGENEIKQALLLAACNPRISGVIIYGRRGSGKSCLARAIHRLLPTEIKRVKQSLYNVDPSDEHAVDSLLQESLARSGKSLQDLETEFIPTPLVNLPLNVMEDSLLGSVDLEASMESGKTLFSPGLLARAHRGILQVDDINLLDEETLSILFNVLTDGFVHVEREGLSVEYPCRPLFLATFNPEEGDLSEHFLDRVAIALPTTTEKLNTEERVHAVVNVEGYREKELSLEGAEKEDERLRKAIIDAKRLLPKVEISQDQILYLCEEATRARCEGQRAEGFATEIAKTSAALNGKTKVEAADLELGVMLAIVPRSHLVEVSEETVEEEPSYAPSTDQQENTEREDNEEEQEEESEESPEQQEEEEEEVIEIPEDLCLESTPHPSTPGFLNSRNGLERARAERLRVYTTCSAADSSRPSFRKATGRKATLRLELPYERQLLTKRSGAAMPKKTSWSIFEPATFVSSACPVRRVVSLSLSWTPRDQWP